MISLFGYCLLRSVITKFKLSIVALALDSQILKDKLVPISQYDQKPNSIISHNNIIK